MVKAAGRKSSNCLRAVGENKETQVARNEQDREDLLAEATGLTPRVEFADPQGRTVLVGFRGSGASSVYFDAAPVYHFNSSGELRRAFIDGRIYKAEAGRLIALEKLRQAGQVVLQRHELSEKEMRNLLAAGAKRLRQFALERASRAVAGPGAGAVGYRRGGPG